MVEFRILLVNLIVLMNHNQFELERKYQVNKQFLRLGQTYIWTESSIAELVAGDNQIDYST